MTGARELHHGIYLPIFDRLADPRLLSDLAAEVEAAGWDGCFLWDHVYYRPPVRSVTDPWIALAAMAVATDRIRIGPLVTPLARRRPQVVARQISALDHLSAGRMIFGAGLGLDSSGGELSRFGEEVDDRRRATILDEALDLLRALLSGDHLDHHGEFFQAGDVTFLPPPVQPRLPFWLAARWPHRRPLARAARFDGVFLIDLDGPAHLVEARARLDAARPRPEETFDVVVRVPPGSATRPWADAGATWSLVSFDAFTADADTVRRVIKAGPC